MEHCPGPLAPSVSHLGRSVVRVSPPARLWRSPLSLRELLHLGRKPSTVDKEQKSLLFPRAGAGAGAVEWLCGLP